MPQIHAKPSAGVADARLNADPSRTAAVQLKRSLAVQGFDDAARALVPEEQNVQAVASAGTQSGAGPMPHLGRIQQAFGGHDVGAVQAHVGGQAAAATESLGATAYATGNHVAFGDSPDLHTAAHEAAHIVQQRGHQAPAAGLGERGDAYEQNADAVADAVVAGRSAAPLLDAYDTPTAVGAAVGDAVQCYSETSDFETNAAEGENLFTKHDELPTVAEDSMNGLEYKVTHDKPQALKVSDDGKLAIQGEGQSQEFFAEAGMVTAWNKQLEGNGTAVRLEEQGGSVTVKGEQRVQIKPTLDGELLESFFDNECISVANIILGKAPSDKDFQAIFEGEKHGKRTADFTSKNINKAANYALDESSSTKSPEKGLKKAKDKKVGKEYGMALGAGALDDRTEKLGINEHAKPEVGEAYVTYSVRDKEESKREVDYTGYEDRNPEEKGKKNPLVKKFGKKMFDKQNAPRSTERAWDMHYAGVVAVSGGDRVTLEDYNRRDETELMKADLLKQLKEQYANEIGNFDGGKNPTETITFLQQKMNNLDFGAARKLAQKVVMSTGKSTWFFKMYGSGKGQSFHEIEHEGEDTVNPLTLRVGKKPTDKKNKKK